MQKKIPVAVILQCYNSEQVISSACDKILRIIKSMIKRELIPETSYLYLIDGGSVDQTWYEIGKIVARNPGLVKAIKLKTEAKLSAIIKNSGYGQSIIVNFENYSQIEHYVKTTDKSVIIDKFNFIKDIMKSDKLVIIDEY